MKISRDTLYTLVILLTLFFVSTPLVSAISVETYRDEFPHMDDIILEDIETIILVRYDENPDGHLEQLEDMPYIGVWYTIDLHQPSGTQVLGFFYKSVPETYPSSAIFVYINKSSGNPSYVEYYTYDYKKTVYPDDTVTDIAQFREYTISDSISSRSIYSLPLNSDYYSVMEPYNVFLLVICVISLTLIVLVFRSRLRQQT